LSAIVGKKAACAALALPRSQMYPRLCLPGVTHAVGNAQIGLQRALSQTENMETLAVLNSDRFMDASPREVYGSLLSEGTYLCHWRTMYRRLAAEDGLVRERRAQARRPVYVKPQLRAEAPNRVWSWDITRLLLVTKWVYLYLYVILDIFSRFVVGWMIADQESAEQAKHFISVTCSNHHIAPDQLTIHADRGAPMKAKTTSQLFADLHVTESHSRPRVSDDNPFSEAQFKTLKYAPTYPKAFDSRSHADDWAAPFFHWYNFQHHHSSLALFTPADLHFNRVNSIHAIRQTALDAAFAANPARFGLQRPLAARPPSFAAINWPSQEVPAP
jgi:putative transposase